MKQLFILFSLTILLVACSDKDENQNATDSTSIVSSNDRIDTTTNTLSDGYNSGEPYTNSEIINKPGSITIVTHKTNIYSDSLLQTSTMFVLNPEEHISIENYCGITTKNNWAEPVYKITYNTGTNIVRGYVSQSSIACRTDTLKSGKLVTLTLDYDISKEKFIGKIALLNRGWDIIAHTSVELDILMEDQVPHSYTYYFSFEEKETTGLDGITESFSISTNYDACGYPGYEYIFVWNDKKLIAFPETYSIAEAGQFHEYSYWVFPADSLGKKGSVFKIIEGDQYEDVVGNIQTINKDSTVIEYKWNSGNFNFSEGDTILKKSSTYSVSADY